MVSGSSLFWDIRAEKTAEPSEGSFISAVLKEGCFVRLLIEPAFWKGVLAPPC